MKVMKLANNEQWLTDNYQNVLVGTELKRPTGGTLADEEEHILRCLGAALIMQWNTLPTKVRRELFDNAGSMGALLETAALRGQIAHFLHKHKNDEDPAIHSNTSIQATAIARWDDEGGAVLMPERQTPAE